MLTYDITNERLFGTIGNEHISIWARSGGGRGSKVHPEGQPGQEGLASWNTQRKEAGTTRGGPIPSGFYTVQPPANHHTLGRASYLEQTVTSLLYANLSAAAGVSATDRDGFYIHGRGRKGSDGCIVPMEDFAHLMDLLATSAPLMLHVVSAGVRMDKLPPAIPGNLA